MEYNLIRSKRKNLTLKITDNAELLVLAPKKISIEKINQFISEKQKWIEEKIDIQNNNIKQFQKYYNLNELLLFGDNYTIEDNYKFYLIGDYYVKHSQASNKEKIIKDFLKKVANQYITERVRLIAEKINCKYSSVEINSTRHSWGSCNSKKELKFTFRLIMLPKQLIDYVICHELCHTIELNHSKKFWQLLNSLGYKKTVVKKEFNNYRFVLNLL